MIKITNLEQIKNIYIDSNNIFYIYGKIGSGKTCFSKDLMKQNNKEAFYTTFEDIVRNISNELYIINLLGKEFIIIDDEIKQIENKDMVCYSIKNKLKEIQNGGMKIIVVGSLNIEDLKQKNIPLLDYILSGEQIEICYDLDTRIKIAENHMKDNKVKIDKIQIENIAQDENLGKIKGKINQISIKY